MADFQGVTLSNDLVPVEVLARVSADINEDDFKLRLRSGGTMRLDNSIWKLGEPNFQANGLVFAALDVLELRNNSKIVTNGNTLVLFVNKFISEDGQIISFEDDFLKAKAGTDGQATGEAGRPGMPGDNAGLVSIHIIDELDGIVHVNLRGQNGGNGGNGVVGAKGFTGSPGADSVTVRIGGLIPIPRCEREATSGSKGGTGQPGGHGGDGGVGGSGGIFQLFNLGTAPISDARYAFTAAAGQGGNGGTGANGGPGGDGGPGGRGSESCHGANGGPVGDQGQKGDDGNAGLNAAEGQKLVRNIDIEIVIRHAVANGGSDHQEAIVSNTNSAAKNDKYK